MDQKAGIQVIVASHKVYPMPDDKMYLPVLVGAALNPEIPDGFLRDDKGENISSKNLRFCELTGLYWAWKNLDAEYIGLVHYRRHFKGKSGILTENEARALLGFYDSDDVTSFPDEPKKILLPRMRNYYIESIHSHYGHTFDIRPLDMAGEIILEMYPDYAEDYVSFMKMSRGYMFNMMIMERGLLDEYCKWLFSVLSELEKRAADSRITEELSDFENRFYGRISERLFNIWLMNRIRTGRLKEEDIALAPVYYTEPVRWPIKILRFLQAKLFGRKYTESF